MTRLSKRVWLHFATTPPMPTQLRPLWKIWIGTCSPIASVSARLTANVENVVGYRKEIDYALERIAAIEKHLGIEKKIAAYAAAEVLPKNP